MRPAAASHAFVRTPDADIFISTSAIHATTFIADEENHLHGISGCQRTASYSFVLIPDTDKEGSGGMRFFERKLPRHLSVSGILLCCPFAPRCLFFPPPPKKKQSAQLNGRSRGLYYTEVGGGTRTEEGGSAEGGKGSAPNLYHSGTRARWGIRRVLSSVCWLIWAHPVLQEWASQAPIWHSLIRKEIEGGGSELAGCSIHKCQPWSNSPRSGIQHLWWYMSKNWFDLCALKGKVW